MESDGLLSCSQESATDHYLMSDESSPHIPTYLPKIHFNNISLLRRGLLSARLVMSFDQNTVCISSFCTLTLI